MHTAAGIIAAFALGSGCAAIAALPSGPSPSAATQQAAVEIVFIDVGQGDAALITAPDGRRVLIDGGPRNSGVAAYLRDRGIDTVDLVIASHNHADHIAGLEDVFATLGVRYYMENGLPSATQTYARLVGAVERSGAVVLTAEQRSIAFGDLRIHVLPFPPGAASQNTRSIGLVLQLGAFHAMFTGDAEVETLAWWVAYVALTRMSVVKVAHHGAGNGTITDFVRMTSPSVAVMSVGATNQYGHPSPIAVNMWTSVARYVLRTDRDGSVAVLGAADGSMRLWTAGGAPPLRDVPIAARSETSALEGRR